MEVIKENGIENSVLLVADSRNGVYMARIFLNNFYKTKEFNLHSSFNSDVETILNSDPYSDNYFESVESVINNVTLTISGKEYFVVFNEDLWAVAKDVDQDKLDNWWI
jgi:hypothetical protein|tara:strand:- start:492 stop:815 length:324 start_codon:yes stop_codon:yes gene_type:complete